MSTTMTHPSCNYCMCCITVGNSPSFSAATLFHTSFVSREVAAWIELQAKGDKGYAKRRRLTPETAAASVSLAGTCYKFLLNLNEVTQSHETIRNIHAQVLDSCIAVIISRPLIRENHLVQKIPLYFDEQPSSKPHQSQSVLTIINESEEPWHAVLC